MKATARGGLTVGGPGLAAQAIRAGLVDEYHLFLTAVVVGGGKQARPDGVRLQLELLDERRFGGGVVYLHYRAKAKNTRALDPRPPRFEAMRVRSSHRRSSR
jgi:dihydrofolate reductase